MGFDEFRRFQGRLSCFSSAILAVFLPHPYLFFQLQKEVRFYLIDSEVSLV